MRPSASLARGALLWCLLIATFLAAWVGYSSLWKSAPVSSGDTEGYHQVAKDLSDGALDELHDRTLGYPMVLLLTGAVDQPTRALFHFQFLLHLMAVGLLALWLRMLALPDRAVFLFGALAMLPPLVEASAFVLTENATRFALVLTFVGLWYAVTRNSVAAALAAGLASGLAALVRPTFQLLAPALVATGILCLALSRLSRRASDAPRPGPSRVRVAVAFVLASLAIVGALVSFNRVAFSYSGMTPMLGFNLSSRTTTFVERLPAEYEPVRSVLIRYRDQELIESPSHSGHRYIWEARTELQQVTGLDRTELSNYLVDLNLELIRSAPLNYLRLVGQAVIDFFFPSSGRMSFFGSAGLQAIWGLLHGALFGLFFSLCWGLPPQALRGLPWGSDGVRAQRWLGFSLVAAMIAYTAAVSCLVEAGEARYRAPLDLLVLAVVFAALPSRSDRTGRPDRRAGTSPGRCGRCGGGRYPPDD